MLIMRSSLGATCTAADTIFSVCLFGLFPQTASLQTQRIHGRFLGSSLPTQRESDERQRQDV